MMARWTELLPLFVVRWIALRHCERVTIDNKVICVMARPDVLIRVPASVDEGAGVQR